MAPRFDDVEHVGDVARRQEVDGLAHIFRTHRDRRHPLGGVGLRVLLVEELTVNAVGHPLERQRSVLDVGDHRGGDVEVVREQIAFGEPFFRPVDLVEVRQPQLALAGARVPVLPPLNGGELHREPDRRLGAHEPSLCTSHRTLAAGLDEGPPVGDPSWPVDHVNLRGAWILAVGAVAVVSAPAVTSRTSSSCVAAPGEGAGATRSIPERLS